MVQLLLHGITHDRRYWDFPYGSGTYSYPKSAVDNFGFATLAIDRLGTGESSWPPTIETSPNQQVATFHSIVEQLRRGNIGGVKFDKVIAVGHSRGALLIEYWTSIFPKDMDHIVLTGWYRDVDISTKPYLDLFKSLVPVNEVHTNMNAPDSNYMTIATEDTRISLFFHSHLYESKVGDIDYAVSQPFTTTEDKKIMTMTAGTTRFKGTVLVMAGEYDGFGCVNRACTKSIFKNEPSYWKGASKFATWLMPATGNSINLHRNAPSASAYINGWLLRNGVNPFV
ncbi:hypothetical protein COEREDRAFT_83900 [Coemansia reversa NRRL 1564]|uniref:AB hydrolase-1 domain-containing protein n=1 Tax=Coemansia reversa (strain ATCC 12441 / NRRL 1564) TaxID=763665 RepID=A0A2G5B1C1_COERN|nr:hypothetical protein COEREDRAFT_83900 [Coemansia reversa NRRL 1564]|eukprot:PIA12801.1 hypothetical protein COEREDRAFT_83900 [Coemansia reversa NRRL 1564]